MKLQQSSTLLLAFGLSLGLGACTTKSKKSKLTQDGKSAVQKEQKQEDQSQDTEEVEPDQTQQSDPTTQIVSQPGTRPNQRTQPGLSNVIICSQDFINDADELASVIAALEGMVPAKGSPEALDQDKLEHTLNNELLAASAAGVDFEVQYAGTVCYEQDGKALVKHDADQIIQNYRIRLQNISVALNKLIAAIPGQGQSRQGHDQGQQQY